MIDHELVKRVYSQGNGYKRTARIVGCSGTTVRRIVLPEYAERSRIDARANKRRRTGICRECGGKTRYNGRGKATSGLCAACNYRLAHELRCWTRETVIAAIQEWAREHGGLPPTATEWQRRSRGQRYPAAGTVYGKRSGLFDSWADAIEAAGFPRPAIGRRRKVTA